MSNHSITRVIALGNPLRGDDGAGAAILRQLEAAPLPPDVELIDGGTAGLETVLLLQDCQHAIVVDAAEMGSTPGTWRQFTPGQVRLGAADIGLRGTLHYAGLAEALALGEALGTLPPAIDIYGIQPDTIGWTPGLSAPVQQAIPEVGAAILRTLYEDYANDRCKDSAD